MGTRKTIFIGGLLFASLFLFSGLVLGQENKPVLFDRFKPSGLCEEDYIRIDGLLAKINDDKAKTGWVFVPARKNNSAENFRRFERIKDRLKEFPSASLRLITVKMPASDDPEFQLWISTEGGEQPEPDVEGETEESDWTIDPMEATKPFIFNTDRGDEYNGCLYLDLPVYAKVLVANPAWRGNIVIYAYSRASFRKRSRKIVAELANAGVENKRIRTFYVWQEGFKFEMFKYVKDEPELWLLP